jgi:hypothetical protein
MNPYAGKQQRNSAKSSEDCQLRAPRCGILGKDFLERSDIRNRLCWVSFADNAACRSDERVAWYSIRRQIPGNHPKLDNELTADSGADSVSNNDRRRQPFRSRTLSSLRALSGSGRSGAIAVSGPPVVFQDKLEVIQHRVWYRSCPQIESGVKKGGQDDEALGGHSFVISPVTRPTR